MLYLISPYYWGVELKKRLSQKVYIGKVISIGNIEMGGTGKTPLVIEVAEFLKNQGINTMVLSRGYRRKYRKPCITSEKLSAVECGDEPYMIFKRTGVPVYVDRKRENVKKIVTDKNTVFILDDGFQYFKLKRDVDIVVLSGKIIQKGGHVFPFGYLREPLRAIKRADIILVNFRFQKPENVIPLYDKPTFAAHYIVNGIFDVEGKKHNLKSQDVILLSAIAKNREFKEIVEKKLNLKVIRHIAFVDHTYFKERLLCDLVQSRLPVITTEKDFYRIQHPVKEKLLYVRIGLEILEKQRFFELLLNRLNHQS